jgi:hypothetical protein
MSKMQEKIFLVLAHESIGRKKQLQSFIRPKMRPLRFGAGKVKKVSDAHLNETKALVLRLLEDDISNG